MRAAQTERGRLITILRTSNAYDSFVVSYVKDGSLFFAVTEVME